VACSVIANLLNPFELMFIDGKPSFRMGSGIVEKASKPT